MSYTATMTSRIDVAGKRIIALGKMVFFILFLIATVVIVHEVYQSPKYQSFLPESVRHSIRDVKKYYMDSFRKDIVVFTQNIDGKSLKAKTNRMARYNNGVAAEVQSKTFQLNSNLEATVKAEIFHTSKIAEHMLIAFGGSTSDQLDIGTPSFFKTHGLGAHSVYFLTTLALYEDTLVTVTLNYKLSKNESRIANGPSYESFMNKLAEGHLEKALFIQKMQIKRLKFLSAN